MKTIEQLGEKAVRLGYLSSGQIDEALEQQQQRRNEGKQHQLLGLLLVDQGYLTADQLVSMLNGEDHSSVPLTRDAVSLAARLSRSLDVSDKTIMFAGVSQADGADQVATQVALALASMRRGQVLLLDADLLQSPIHAQFNISQTPGFSDVLAGHCSVEKAVVASPSPNLFIMPAGSGQYDLSKLLLSDSGDSHMKELCGRYLFVVIHSPPLPNSPAGSLLAIASDAIVTVAAAGKRTTDQVMDIKRTLDGLRVRSLGIVLTEQGRYGQKDKRAGRSTGRL